MPRRRQRQPRLAAVHEAGHVVAAACHGFAVHEAALTADGNGWCRFAGPAALALPEAFALAVPTAAGDAAARRFLRRVRVPYKEAQRPPGERPDERPAVAPSLAAAFGARGATDAERVALALAPWADRSRSLLLGYLGVVDVAADRMMRRRRVWRAVRAVAVALDRAGRLDAAALAELCAPVRDLCLPLRDAHPQLVGAWGAPPDTPERHRLSPAHLRVACCGEAMPGWRPADDERPRCATCETVSRGLWFDVPRRPEPLPFEALAALVAAALGTPGADERAADGDGGVSSAAAVAAGGRSADGGPGCPAPTRPRRPYLRPPEELPAVAASWPAPAVGAPDCASDEAGALSMGAGVGRGGRSADAGPGMQAPTRPRRSVRPAPPSQAAARLLSDGL